MCESQFFAYITPQKHVSNKFKKKFIRYLSLFNYVKRKLMKKTLRVVKKDRTAEEKYNYVYKY